MTTVKTRPANTDLSFDTQIQAVISTLLPWLLGIRGWDNFVGRDFLLDPRGYWVENYGATQVQEREGMKVLISFLELSVGGKVKWKSDRNKTEPYCEIRRPDMTGPFWIVSSKGLCGSAEDLRSTRTSAPRLWISYWRGN